MEISFERVTPSKIVLYATTIGLLCNIRTAKPCERSGCEFTCSGGSGDWTNLYLAYRSSTCQSNGINLTFRSHPDVPGKIWNADWFSIADNMNIAVLQIYLDHTTEIRGEPFGKATFQNVKYLRLNNLHTENLPANTFNGLNNLEELIITNAVIHNYSNGILEHFKQPNRCLKSFSLIERTEAGSIAISAFVGGSSTNVTSLGYVKIQYNLSIIDNSSLTSIPFVEVLDLSKCYIIAIKEHSFDFLASNLRLLNLEQNKLTTLPTGLFSGLTSINLTIQLLGNPWQCDCYVQELLLNYSSSYEDTLCASPENGTQIKLAEFCTSETTAEITAPTITAPTTPINEIDDDEFPTKECQASHTNITISPKTHNLQLSLLSGQNPIKLQVDQSQDMLLIWFGTEILSTPNLPHGEAIDCVVNFPSVMELTDLKEGVTYIFCLMSTASTTVSPLNCLSYHHRKIQEEFTGIWMYEKSKTAVISVIIVSLVVAAVSGFFIGTFLMRRVLSFGHTETTSITVEHTVRRSSVPHTTTNFEIDSEEPCTTKDIKIDRPPPPLPPEYGNEYDEDFYSVVM